MDGIRLLVFVSIGAFVFSGCSPQSGKVNQVTSSFDAIKCRTTAAIETEFIVQWENGKFSVEKGVDPEQFKDEFVTPQVEQIKHVQINQKIHLVNPVVEQAGELSSQAANNWGQNVIHASSVWSAGYKGQNIKVAVVDSIVDVDHPQLRTRIDINSGEMELMTIITVTLTIMLELSFFQAPQAVRSMITEAMSLELLPQIRLKAPCLEWHPRLKLFPLLS
jgi:subtilisin family serine protease